jgi:hypothetical protein
VFSDVFVDGLVVVVVVVVVLSQVLQHWYEEKRNLTYLLMVVKQ